MFSAILILLIMPFTDLGRFRGIQFRPLSKIAFFVFVANFLILMQLGAKHVESPFIEFGQISTVIYFAYFLIIVPLVSLVENTLVELAVTKKKSLNNNDSKFFRISFKDSIVNIFYKIFDKLPLLRTIRFIMVSIIISVLILIFNFDFVYCTDNNTEAIKFLKDEVEF